MPQGKVLSFVAIALAAMADICPHIRSDYIYLIRHRDTERRKRGGVILPILAPSQSVKVCNIFRNPTV